MCFDVLVNVRGVKLHRDWRSTFICMPAHSCLHFEYIHRSFPRFHSLNIMAIRDRLCELAVTALSVRFRIEIDFPTCLRNTANHSRIGAYQQSCEPYSQRVVGYIRHYQPGQWFLTFTRKTYDTTQVSHHIYAQRAKPTALPCRLCHSEC